MIMVMVGKYDRWSGGCTETCGGGGEKDGVLRGVGCTALWEIGVVDWDGG